MRAGVTFGKKGEAKVLPYEVALREAGIEPVRNPHSLESLDGLLLTGGTDINPRYYGQERLSLTGWPDDERDELEMRLLREALSAERPVLAICRGMQLFNVFHGGTLIQHLPSSDVHRQKSKHAEPGKHPAAHRIHVNADTQLARIIGAGEHEVNSRHHQAVDRRGDGLIVSAISSDGVIEGLELPAKLFAIAVQWHPEDRIQVSSEDRKLFEAFAVALETYSRDAAGRTSRSTADQPGHPRLSA
jgi:putative glutamine amidotransferase